jgi:hypothetical protein
MNVGLLVEKQIRVHIKKFIWQPLPDFRVDQELANRLDESDIQLSSSIVYRSQSLTRHSSEWKQVDEPDFFEELNSRK